MVFLLEPNLIFGILSAGHAGTDIIAITDLSSCHYQHTH
jgi:hypothetical protein